MELIMYKYSNTCSEFLPLKGNYLLSHAGDAGHAQHRIIIFPKTIEISTGIFSFHPSRPTFVSIDCWVHSSIPIGREGNMLPQELCLTYIISLVVYYQKIPICMQYLSPQIFEESWLSELRATIVWWLIVIFVIKIKGIFFSVLSFCVFLLYFVIFLNLFKYFSRINESKKYRIN